MISYTFSFRDPLQSHTLFFGINTSESPNKIRWGFFKQNFQQNEKNTDTDTRLNSGFTDSPSPSPKKLMLLCLSNSRLGAVWLFLIRDISCDFLMKQMCLDAWHVRAHEFVTETLGFFSGGLTIWSGNKKRDEVYRSRCFGPMGEPSFQKATPVFRWTSLHSTTGCGCFCWYFGGSVKCLSKACVLSDFFFLVKCVKIPLGGFVWFIWMNLNIKSLSWTVDNFISPALDRSSEWRNAYWQFTILKPPFACSGN